MPGGLEYSPEEDDVVDPAPLAVNLPPLRLRPKLLLGELVLCTRLLPLAAAATTEGLALRDDGEENFFPPPPKTLEELPPRPLSASCSALCWFFSWVWPPAARVDWEFLRLPIPVTERLVVDDLRLGVPGPGESDLEQQNEVLIGVSHEFTWYLLHMQYGQAKEDEGIGIERSMYNGTERRKKNHKHREREREE